MAGSDFATLGVEIKQTGARETEQAQDRVTASARNLVKAFREMDRAIKQTDKTKQQATKTTKAATDAQDEHQKALTRSSGRLKVIGRDINRYFILPMTAMIGLSSRAAYNLNEGMANVQALIPDTGDRIYELRDSVRDLASETGKSFDDITKGLYRTISVFQDNADTVDRLNTAIQVGIAGYASTAESVQLLSSVTRSYGDTSAEAVNKVADLAFETVRLGDTTIPQLSAAMQVATDRAVRLGISQEELFATMSTLTGITGDASMVATQFRSAMDSILNPTEAMNDLLGDMGYKTAQAAIEQEGMIGLLVAIAREAERAERPLQDFITRKEGITLVSRLAGEQLQDFTFRLGEIEDSTGAANEAFRNVTEGVGRHNFAIRQAKERINSLMSEIGDNLLPVLASTLTIVGDIVEAFSNLPDGIQRSTIALTGLATAASIFLQVWGALRGLKIVSVMGGIGRAAAHALGPTSGLLGTLTAIGGTAGVLLAIAAVVGVTIVAANREAEESAERANKRFENMTQYLDELQKAAGATERSFKAMVLAEEDVFRDRQSIPTYSMDLVRGPVQSGERFLSSLNSQAAVDAQIKEYERLLNNLEQGITKANRDKERELIEAVTQPREQLERIISEQQDPGLGPNAFEQWAMQVLGIRDPDIISEDIMNNLDVVFASVSKQMQKLERFDQGVLPFTGMEELVRNRDSVETLYNVLSSLIGTEQELAQVRTNLNHAEEVSAQMEAAINLLTDFDPGEGISDDVKWRKIFESVTDVNVIGKSAAMEYDRVLSQIEDRTRSFYTTMGAEVDEVAILTDSIETRLDHLRTLLVDHGDVFGEGGIEGIFTGQAGVGGLPEDYQNLIDQIETRVSDVVATLQSESNTLTDSFGSMWSALGEGEYDLFKIESALTAYEDQIDRVQKTQDMLASTPLGASPELAADIQFLQALIDALERAQDEAEKLGEKLSFQDRLGDLGDQWGVFWKDVFENGFRTAIDNMMEKWDEFLDGIDKAEAKAEIMSTFMQDALVAIGEEIQNSVINSFYDMGRAMTDSEATMDNFFAALMRNILNTLPQLMIQAGLMLVASGNFGLGLGLMALGLISATGAGAIQGWMDEESRTDNAHGNAFNNGSVIPYKDGGVINSPTLFPMKNGTGLMGEAGPEAILPLTRTSNGDLGVKGDGGTPVVVNVINNGSSTEATVSEETGPDGSRQIRVMIEDTVDGALARGRFNRSLSSKYGLKPQGVRV